MKQSKFDITDKLTRPLITGKTETGNHSSQTNNAETRNQVKEINIQSKTLSMSTRDKSLPGENWKPQSPNSQFLQLQGEVQNLENYPPYQTREEVKFGIQKKKRVILERKRDEKIQR